MRTFLKTEIFSSVLTQVFENALRSGDFRKRPFRVYVWTGENDRVTSIAMVICDADFVHVFQIVKPKFMAILLGMMSSLTACFQPCVAMINVHREYLTRRKKLDFIIRPNMIQVCLLA